ncbi:MAG: hypothetical protein PVG16_02000 [Chromatiales bacterium]
MKFAIDGATPPDPFPGSIDLHQFARSGCNANGQLTLTGDREA